MKNLQEALNYQPHTLTNNEVDHPEAFITHFYECHALHTTRANLTAFYEAWLMQHADHPNGETIKDMMFFFNSMIDLVNAGYALHHHHAEKESVSV